MVSVASFNLEGEGQRWFLKLEKDHPSLSWDEFKGFCLKRFGPPIRDDILGELSKLHQVGSVKDYIRQFEDLAAQADCLFSKQEAQIFVSGLKLHITIDVRIHQPRSE